MSGESEFDRLKAQKDAILNREREVMKAVLDDAAAKRIAFLEAKVSELEAKFSEKQRYATMLAESVAELEARLSAKEE